MSATERVPLSRAAIVARAVAVVDEEGVGGLSLRSLARDLGVSAPALYDHIRSKDDLVRLVAAEGYAELAGRWEDLDTVDPVAWMRRSSQAYVEFALERPGLFDVMFRFRPAFVQGPDEIEEPAATAVFERALAAVDSAVTAGTLHGDPLHLALAIWAATHGVATVLAMAPQLAEQQWMVDLVVDGLLAGWEKEPS